jgi:hypothetical protein
MSNTERHYFKENSGSDRDKRFSTPKQDKWKDPFYCEARGYSRVYKQLFSHKVDSIREHLQGVRDEVKTGFFGRIKNAIVNLFTRNRSRKGLA